MRVYTTLESCRANLGAVRKWQRTLEAIATADPTSGVGPELALDAAYSLGDSLTFWRADDAALGAERFTGHRRYHEVLAPVRGDLTVMVASKSRLESHGDYSDDSDRETFGGDGDAAERVVVPCGGVLIVGIDEAFRVEPRQQGETVVVHVTVEGFTFPNK